MAQKKSYTNDLGQAMELSIEDGQILIEVGNLNHLDKLEWHRYSLPNEDVAGFKADVTRLIQKINIKP